MQSAQPHATAALLRPVPDAARRWQPGQRLGPRARRSTCSASSATAPGARSARDARVAPPQA